MNTLILDGNGFLQSVVVIWNNGQLDGAIIEEISYTELCVDLRAVQALHNNSALFFKDGQTCNAPEQLAELAERTSSSYICDQLKALVAEIKAA